MGVKKLFTQVLICDFCKKDQHSVKMLIAGPDGIMICDECIDICVEILAETPESAKAAKVAQESEADAAIAHAEKISAEMSPESKNVAVSAFHGGAAYVRALGAILLPTEMPEKLAKSSEYEDGLFSRRNYEAMLDALR